MSPVTSDVFDPYRMFRGRFNGVETSWVVQRAHIVSLSRYNSAFSSITSHDFVRRAQKTNARSAPDQTQLN